MVFDLDLIKKTYSEMPAKVDAAKKHWEDPLRLQRKFCLPIYGKELKSRILREAKLT
jgi:hypothetical protein